MAVSYKGQDTEKAGQSVDTLYQTASLVSSSLLLTTLGGATTIINLSSLSGSFSGSIVGTASYALNGLPPGTSGQILQVNLSNQYQLQTQLNDTIGSSSIDFDGRFMYYFDGITPSIEYGRYGSLYDSAGKISLDFGNTRILSDSSENASILYGTRYLSDANNYYSIDYNNRTLLGVDGTTTTLIWGTNLVTVSGSLIISGSTNSIQGFTGSLFGTASRAVSSSHAITAQTASSVTLSAVRTIGVADLNFGVAPGTNTATVTISQGNVTNNSFINVYVMSTSSADHNIENHKIFALYSRVLPENIINNTSFDIVGITDLRVNGIFKIKYIINN